MNEDAPKLTQIVWAPETPRKRILVTDEELHLINLIRADLGLGPALAQALPQAVSMSHP